MTELMIQQWRPYYWTLNSDRIKSLNSYYYTWHVARHLSLDSMTPGDVGVMPEALFFKHFSDYFFLFGIWLMPHPTWLQKSSQQRCMKGLVSRAWSQYKDGPSRYEDSNNKNKTAMRPCHLYYRYPYFGSKFDRRYSLQSSFKVVVKCSNDFGA